MRLFYFEFPIKRFLQETAKIFNQEVLYTEIKRDRYLHTLISKKPSDRSKIENSNSTIKKYIDYLCDSFVIDSAIRDDVKGKKHIDTPVKYYCAVRHQ